ncbi:MAG: GTP-binding protein, partial [Sphingomonadales bacterium]|nr:GTP-binding protein [Sphingomonadales bacterium]
MSEIAPLIVLAGNPNSGKSALFNALTGARQKIANYPGVTVERKSGHFAFADGRPAELVDLPGSYSLDPTSPDEEVTRSVIMGLQKGERRPDAVILVLDAANLDNHLRFALEVIALGQPVVVALNMMDLAERDGLTLDPEKLSEALGVPVVPTVAVRRRGLEDLSAAVESRLQDKQGDSEPVIAKERGHGLSKQAKRIANLTVVSETAGRRWSERADRLFLHPFAGPLILFGVL